MLFARGPGSTVASTLTTLTTNFNHFLSKTLFMSDIRLPHQAVEALCQR